MQKVKLNLNIEKFRRSKLLEKYIARIFRYDNKKFEDEYSKNIKRNQ